MVLDCLWRGAVLLWVDLFETLRHVLRHIDVHARIQGLVAVQNHEVFENKFVRLIFEDLVIVARLTVGTRDRLGCSLLSHADDHWVAALRRCLLMVVCLGSPGVLFRRDSQTEGW